MKAQRKINGKKVEVFDLESLEEMALNKKYKVIQLDLGEKQATIFGNPKNFHAEIVEAYLQENNISYKKNILEDGNEGPAKQGEDYKIIGAGYITKKENALQLSDKSIGYNISPSTENLNELKKETNLAFIVEDTALKKIKENELLEHKLKFLHPCLVGAFDEANTYFNELKSLIEDKPTKKLIEKKYDSLKKIFSESGEDSLHKPQYVQELRELRDYLFNN